MKYLRTGSISPCESIINYKLHLNLIKSTWRFRICPTACWHRAMCISAENAKYAVKLAKHLTKTFCPMVSFHRRKLKNIDYGNERDLGEKSLMHTGQDSIANFTVQFLRSAL